MEHNQYLSEYENIMRNYPLTVMTKAWNPSYPGAAPTKSYSKVLLPERIRDIVVTSPRLKSLLDTVSLVSSYPFIQPV